jgi:hypothetical protein
MQRFAEVMTDGGTETFIGKSRDDIVQILGERMSVPGDINRAISS